MATKIILNQQFIKEYIETGVDGDIHDIEGSEKEYDTTKTFANLPNDEPITSDEIAKNGKSNWWDMVSSTSLPIVENDKIIEDKLVDRTGVFSDNKSFKNKIPKYSETIDLYNIPDIGNNVQTFINVMNSLIKNKDKDGGDIFVLSLIEILNNISLNNVNENYTNVLKHMINKL